MLERATNVRFPVGSAPARRRAAAVGVSSFALCVAFAAALSSQKRGGVACRFGSPTSQVVRKYAFDAYASWALVVRDRRCPTSLRELDPWMGWRDVRDPWGSEYVMTCATQGIVVQSLGEDRKPDTADDIGSEP